MHLPSDSRISVDPPSTADACLTVEYTELIEAQLVLQLACHGDARGSSAHDYNRIVGIGIMVVAIDASDSLSHGE